MQGLPDPDTTAHADGSVSMFSSSGHMGGDDDPTTDYDEGAIRFDSQGFPVNPRGRTGMRGRGLLGKWGPNHAADPIVTRFHPLSGQLQMVAVQRHDTGRWAIPGGMVDAGEKVLTTISVSTLPASTVT